MDTKMNVMKKEIQQIDYLMTAPSQNKATGTRMRSHLQVIKKICTELRKEILMNSKTKIADVDDVAEVAEVAAVENYEPDPIEVEPEVAAVEKKTRKTRKPRKSVRP
jgi:hypothetical protein